MANMTCQNGIGLQKFLFSKSSKIKGEASYENYAKRIKKTLYYGRLPSTDRPSLPVTGILVDNFGKLCKQDGFNQLNLHEASSICYDACVTPCSVIVALLYLDRLRTQNPEYLSKSPPSQVFIVSLMVASKYLYDDGEEDEVFNDEWATSAAMLLSDLNEAEKDFLSAIDWNLFVDMKLFMEGLLYVESNIALEQGTLRGFFIYSDMVTLSKCLPPLWTSFLTLVGSALVVCFVGYTVTVFTVATGMLATKECSIFVANQIRLGLFPLHSQNRLQFPNCSSGLEHCEDVALYPSEKADLWMESSDVDEKNKRIHSTFTSRFSALRALTTALLLASSSKLTEPPNPFPPSFSAPSICSHEPCTLPSLCSLGRYANFPGFSFNKDFYPRNRNWAGIHKRPNHLRKSCRNLKRNSHYEETCNALEGIVSGGVDLEKRLSSTLPFNKDSHKMLSDDYFYDSSGQLVYSSFPHKPSIEPHSLHQFDISLNFTFLGTSTDYSVLKPLGDHNYYLPQPIMDEVKVVASLSPYLLWTSFLPFSSSPKASGYVEQGGYFKPNNLIMYS